MLIPCLTLVEGIGFACRSSTLSVAVTPETNVSEVKCYSANHANINDTWEPLGNASMQLMPASKPSLFWRGREGWEQWYL